MVCSQWVKGNLVAAAILVLKGARQILGLVLDESNHLMIRWRGDVAILSHLESKPCLAAFPL